MSKLGFFGVRRPGAAVLCCDLAQLFAPSEDKRVTRIVSLVPVPGSSMFRIGSADSAAPGRG
ncbi:MAG: hypothetical protein ACHQT8_08060, partial [Chlamydiales bacterium]